MTIYTAATIVAFAIAYGVAHIISRGGRTVAAAPLILSPNPGREPGRCAGRCDTCSAKLTNDAGFIYCAACTSDQASDCYRSPFQGGGVA